MAYTPLTTTSPANLYFGVDQRISYGNTSILQLTSGVVDTVGGIFTVMQRLSYLTLLAGYHVYLPCN
jgi:hypothetical protein